jgi:ribosomal protein S21
LSRRRPTTSAPTFSWADAAKEAFAEDSGRPPGSAGSADWIPAAPGVELERALVILRVPTVEREDVEVKVHRERLREPPHERHVRKSANARSTNPGMGMSVAARSARSAGHHRDTRGCRTPARGSRAWYRRHSTRGVHASVVPARGARDAGVTRPDRPERPKSDRVDAVSTVKHEFLDGHVWAMAGGSPEDAAVAGNIIALLSEALRGQPCRVYTSDPLASLQELVPVAHEESRAARARLGSARLRAPAGGGLSRPTGRLSGRPPWVSPGPSGRFDRARGPLRIPFAAGPRPTRTQNGTTAREIEGAVGSASFRDLERALKAVIAAL